MSEPSVPTTRNTTSLRTWLRRYFSIHARMSRMPFLLHYLVIVALLLTVKLIAHQVIVDPTRLPGTLLLPPVDVALLFVYLGLSFFPIVKRAHDLGLGGFFFVLTVIPLVNVAALAYLFFYPGKSTPNVWGDPVSSGSIEELSEDGDSDLAVG